MGPYDTGTYALTTVYRASFNDVLRDRAAFSQQYQTGPVSTSTVGPRDPETGSHEAYRYAWERLTSWGGRVSDTMWITRDKGGRS
jgi:hypothetical protein